VENHCSRARVFHAFNVVEPFRQRRRRRNKRRPQFQSKISSGQFHGNTSNVDLRVLLAAVKLDFLSYKNSAAPELRLQFTEMSLQQLLQLARPHYNNGVAFRL